MKTLYNIQLILLLMSDFIYAICAISQNNISLRDIYFCISLTNLFLGPVQFIPAIILLFRKAHRNNYYNLYMILSLLTIFTLVMGFSLYDDGINMTFGLTVQAFSFLLAHYFVYVLHLLNERQSQTIK